MISSKLNPQGVQTCLAVLVALTLIPSKLNAKGVQMCLCVLAFAFALGSASAEVKVTDNLSLSGFLDMSSVITYDGDDTSSSLSFDQFELDFHFNQGSVTGRVDIDSRSQPPSGEIDEGQRVILEQGYVTYTLPGDILPGASITAGKFLSTFGFEPADPIGHYAISLSEGIPYPGYQNGVAVNVKPVDEVGIYAALVSGVWNANDTDVKDPGFEAQVSLTPVEQVTAKIGFAFEDIVVGDTEETRSELNAWAQFTQGPLTLAGEIDMLKNWPSPSGDAIIEDGMHFLGMVNVSLEDVISAPVAVTVRFSGIKLDDKDDATEDMSKEITVSPSYAPNDNWTLLAEVKRRIDAKVTRVAVESRFTF
jgi:hypothetical protein